MSPKKTDYKNKKTSNPPRISAYRWIKSHPTVFWLTLIISLTIFLRFFTLGSESIWLDEAESIRESHLTIQGIAASSNQPPIYFLLLRAWIALFGTSEFAIRSLSAIFGILSIVAIYFTGTTLLNKRVGLISAFLASFAIFVIRHSQDARAYSLLLLLATLSYWFFIELFKTNKTRYYIAYTTVSILLIYTHFFSLFIVASQIMFYIIYIKKYLKSRPRYLISLAILIISVVPMGLLLKNNISNIGRCNFWINEPSYSEFFSTFISFSGSGSMRFVIFAIFVILGIWRVIALLWKTIKSSKKKPKGLKNKNQNVITEEKPGLGTIPTVVLLLLWLLIPLLIPFIESKIAAPIYQAKYVIGAYPALVIIVAQGISSFKSKWIIFPILILIVTLSSFGLYKYYKYDNKEQWRETAQFIEANSRPGDLLFVYKSFYRRPFVYYYQGSLEEQGIRSTKEVTEFINSEDGQALKKQGRLWLVVAYNEPDIFNTLVKAYGKNSVKDIQQYIAITIILFNPSGK